MQRTLGANPRSLCYFLASENQNSTFYTKTKTSSVFAISQNKTSMALFVGPTKDFCAKAKTSSFALFNIAKKVQLEVFVLVQENEFLIFRG